MSTSMNHPWDESITDYVVVSSSGTKLCRYTNEADARQWCVLDHSRHDNTHVVYGPGLRNRLGVYYEGCWFTPVEFDELRGF